MKEYKLRSETIIDIIENIPSDRVETLMSELTEMINQCKLFYDTLKIIDPNAKSNINDLLTWEDNEKGEMSVTHTVNDTEILKTSKTLK